MIYTALRITNDVKDRREMTWREARRQNARADLLAAAWDMVREGGLGALSLRKLAQRAGITTPTVCADFESKDAILDAMFGQAAESFAQTNAGPLPDIAPSSSQWSTLTASRRSAPPMWTGTNCSFSI